MYLINASVKEKTEIKNMKTKYRDQNCGMLSYIVNFSSKYVCCQGIKIQNKVKEPKNNRRYFLKGNYRDSVTRKVVQLRPWGDG